VAGLGGGRVKGGVHPPRPEVAWVPLQLIVTAWLYQPFASGARPGDAEIAGAVASNFNGNKSDDESFPATSVHVPPAEAVPLSGPLYVADVQPAIPERPSVPLQVIRTGWLYHPD